MTELRPAAGAVNPGDESEHSLFFHVTASEICRNRVDPPDGKQ